MNTSEALEWCRENCATIEFEDSGFRVTGSDIPISADRVKVTVRLAHGQLELARASFEETVSAVADAHKLWKERDA